MKSNIKYKRFNYKDEDYLYFRENGKICKIKDEPNTYDLDNNIFPQSYCPINCKDIRFDDINKSILVAEMARMLPGLGKDKVNIDKISLLVVQECNLRCLYCYGDGGKYSDAGYMSIETAIKTIDNFVKKNKSKKVLICFFGGEPLLNFKLIKAVVNHCKSIEKNIDIVFQFEILSNGTLINEEIETFILDNKINIQISLDGKKTQNDMYRCYSSGEGSYDEVINRTKNLREKEALSVRATITPTNMDLCSIYKHLYNLKFKHIFIAPAFNLFSNSDYDNLKIQMIKWMCHMETCIENENYSYIINNMNFIQELYKIDRAIVRKTFCGVANHITAVDIHGNMYPCHRFVNFKEFGTNNMYEYEILNRQILFKLSNERNEVCENCWALNLCASGCIFNNYVEGGKLNYVNPYYCEYFKAISEKMIDIYIKLRENERIFLCQRVAYRTE